MSAREATEPGLTPFQEGLFEYGPDGLCLIATHCRACRRRFYPSVPMCLSCLTTEVEATRLSREGALESFTTVQMPAARIAAPYAVGYVKLPEGLRIFAPIEAHGRALRIGMPMCLATYALGPGPDHALAYCFTPA